MVILTEHNNFTATTDAFQHASGSMPAMSRQTWTLIIEGTKLVLIDNNNNNNNNVNDKNITSTSSNIGFNSTSVDPSARLGEEDMIVELANDTLEVGPPSTPSTDCDSASLPVIDFSDLVTIPELYEDKVQEEKEEEEEEEILTPTVPLIDMDSFVSTCSQASRSSSPAAGDRFQGVDPDLYRGWSGSSDASSPGPFLTAASPDLLLLSPTPTVTATITTSSSFSSITPTIPVVYTSLSCDMSSSSSTSSSSSFSTNEAREVGQPEASMSLTNLQFASSARTLSSSSCDDLSSSSSDVSASPGLDDVTSFSDVITQSVVSGLAMSGGVSLSTGIGALTSSGHDVSLPGIASNTSPNDDVLSTSHGTDNVTSFSADVITAGFSASALMTFTGSDVSTGEVHGPTTSAGEPGTQGDGVHESPLRPAERAEVADIKVMLMDKLTGADNKMAAATLEALTTCSLTPLIKEELKYTIQSRRLAAGKPEMPASEYAASLSNNSRRSARRKKAMTAEERERHTKRQEQNRLAAQRFRQKQKDTEEVLSKKCRKLEGSNSSLQAEIQKLTRETQELQQLLDSHFPRCRRKVPAAKDTH